MYTYVCIYIYSLFTEVFRCSCVCARVDRWPWTGGRARGQVDTSVLKHIYIYIYMYTCRYISCY